MQLSTTEELSFQSNQSGALRVAAHVELAPKGGANNDIALI